MSTMVKARFANSVCQRDLGFGVKKKVLLVFTKGMQRQDCV